MIKNHMKYSRKNKEQKLVRIWRKTPRDMNKIVENKIDDIIENKVSEIKSENRLRFTNYSKYYIGWEIWESDSKGLITVYGRVTGGEIKKTEWEVGVNYVHKIK